MKIVFSDNEEDIGKYYIKKKEKVFEDIVITKEIKDELYNRLNSFIKFELVAYKKSSGNGEEFDRTENGPLYGLKGVPFKLLNKPPVNVTLNPQLPKIVNYAPKNMFDYDSSLEEEREKKFNKSIISAEDIIKDSKIPWVFSWNNRVLNISDIKKRRHRRHKSQKKRMIEASIKAGVMKERRPNILRNKKFVPNPVYIRDGYGNYILQSDQWIYGKGKFNGGHNKGRFNNTKNNKNKFIRNKFNNVNKTFKGNKNSSNKNKRQQ
ncbi:hypothetical protein BCR32DRAFT_293739 [Anaeromyces robustus]|uniref:Uncharacterized protein n=1 Tax=Anaeromyces robustus TaxID=1754192 RepID=A0A1Y1X476_9FUNG|nr:hypothetical protein BCR32DRAFT_293739 [Anaeromyces robustus]|eukprot:ORX80617.1 hypothetical protein BCR32DRAFT_293739 [Anaeromyces robustus]